METITENKVIVGIENLKDEFRRAKLKVGDLRGLKNRFDLSKRLGVAPLHTFFFSMGGNGKERCEVYAEITPIGKDTSLTVYSIKEMVEEINGWNENEFEVQFCNARWNQHRTDANRSNLEVFTFRKS